MTSESSISIVQENCDSQYPSKFMTITEEGGFGSGQANNVSRRNSGGSSSNSNSNSSHGSLTMDPIVLERQAELMMKLSQASSKVTAPASCDTSSFVQTAGDISSGLDTMSRSNNNTNTNTNSSQQQQQRRRSADPFDLYVQLQKRKQQQQQQHLGDNNGSGGGISMQNSVSFSPMSSSTRINTLGSMSNMSNMGSLSKLSCGDLSVLLSQVGAVAGTMNGTNNQSWGNLNNMTSSSRNERMHSSLPSIMNSSFGGMNNISHNINHNHNHSRSMNAMNGMNMNMNMNMNNHINSQRSNNNNNNNHHGMSRESSSNDLIDAMLTDEIGSSFYDVGSSLNGNKNGASNNNRNSNTLNGGPIVPPKDFSTLTNDQLRELIIMDATGGNGGGIGGSINTTQQGCSNSTGNTNNPFLKNLGIMDYRNHVMPLSLRQHSSNSRRRLRSSSININEQQHKQSMLLLSSTSDHTSSSTSTGFMSNGSSAHTNLGGFGANNTNNVLSKSDSNFSYSLSDPQQQGATMPDEQESYTAAANGILAPWSARAAGLFGDMMEQSNEEEKTKKASRKKPKDKPKRPLSAYNIFFKEERNRILIDIPAKNSSTSTFNANGHDDGDSDVDGDGDCDTDADADGVPNTITTGDDDIDNNNNVSADVVTSEGISTTATKNQSNLKPAHGKIGFESLAKLIGKRWQGLDDETMSVYKSKAGVDMDRYKREMEVWDTKHGTKSRKRGGSTITNNNNNNNDNTKMKRRRSSCIGAIITTTTTTTAELVSSSSLQQQQQQQQEQQQRRNSTGGAVADFSSKPSSLSSSQLTSRSSQLESDLFLLATVHGKSIEEV